MGSLAVALVVGSSRFQWLICFQRLMSEKHCHLNYFHSFQCLHNWICNCDQQEPLTQLNGILCNWRISCLHYMACESLRVCHPGHPGNLESPICSWIHPLFPSIFPVSALVTFHLWVHPRLHHMFLWWLCALLSNQVEIEISNHCRSLRLLGSCFRQKYMHSTDITKVSFCLRIVQWNANTLTLISDCSVCFVLCILQVLTSRQHFGHISF